MPRLAAEPGVILYVTAAIKNPRPPGRGFCNPGASRPRVSATPGEDARRDYFDVFKYSASVLR
jgi:hypothetical protein